MYSRAGSGNKKVKEIVRASCANKKGQRIVRARYGGEMDF